MFLAKGKMGRTQVVVAVQDFSFMAAQWEWELETQ